MANTQKGGKKGRKIGREARRPAHKRYNAEKRWRINKMKRILQSCGELFLRRWKVEN